MNEWVLLGIGLILTLGTGVFVASEFALVSLDRADLESRRSAGETGYGPTIRALTRTSTHLSSAQLGITLTTLLTGWTMEPALTSLLSSPLMAWGVPVGAVPFVGATIAITGATLLSMVVGELAPKNMAIAEPRAVAKVVVPLQLAFSWVFKPLITVLVSSANFLVRAVGVEPKEELSSARTAEELASVVRHSTLHGGLERDTATLLSKAISFSEHQAQDIMTPRPRLATVKRGDTADAIIELTRKTGYSRFPVIGENSDDVTGVVHVKQAVAVPRDRRTEVPASALQTDALRVPETMALDDLLAELRARGYQMAIVVDEYGGTAGVATLEDLIEELIGEVSDEHDRAKADVVRGRNWLTFPASLRPDELAERAAVDVPDDGPWETVGGYLLSLLGRIPEAGDTVEACDGVFLIERMDGRRIDRVRFTPQEVDR